MSASAPGEPPSICTASTPVCASGFGSASGAAASSFTPASMAGHCAGLAGAMDILVWQFRLSPNDIQTSTIGFLGIAVALLGRNTAIGVFFSALLFGGLVNGTSVRNLDPAVFSPHLASNLTLIIQGVVVLLVSAPVLVSMVLGTRRRLQTKALTTQPDSDRPVPPSKPASIGSDSTPETVPDSNLATVSKMSPSNQTPPTT